MLWPQVQKAGQQKLQQLLQTGRWRLIYRDSVSWLLVRSSLVLPAGLKPAPDSPWRDLSVAQISAWSGRPDRAIEYGEKVRKVIPWHRGACNLLTYVYRSKGENGPAEKILQECRGYFPSYLLR